MNHNYKLTDFKIMKESETDIYEQVISVDLSCIKELPVIIVQRLENMINNMIIAYEQEHNVTIPLETMELSMHMDIDTKSNELSINTYVGYSLDKECITAKEMITATDADYEIIKKYFFCRLNEFVFGQIKRIHGCVA